ncbi:MAG: putative DNA binding domain-containing protein [Candidatus Margulisbacteria bacterium]|nr:putative DNA binding domain-containing protein [Candidatus Margulisiibacteriota bacterium]
MVWGIEATSQDILGTTFNPKDKKVGNEELENWLLHLISPKINICFYEINMEQGKVVILEVGRASHQPVQFKNIEYVRIGSYKKKLKEFSEKERQLWRIFEDIPFEDLSALDDVEPDDILRLLDYPAYFDLLKHPLPDNKQGILARLTEDNMIKKNEAGCYDITNLGAILFAKKLDDFKSLKRKSIRVVLYETSSRIKTIKEQIGIKGYATGFEGLIDFINGFIPRNEIIGKALRKDVPMYPVIAIRELLANAIIHQNFFIHGVGPMIEIFSDRIEITNPGMPLIKTERFLDSPPKSRNEALASFMRRIGICEERGSGIDKAVFETEFYQLPAPLFEVIEDNTRATLFAHRPLSKMDRQDRVRATYLHACLRYVQREFLTNSSLRERFGVQKGNSAMVSRFIKEAIEDKLIKPTEPEKESRKHAKYMPFWA